jgi:hypothetical protein
MNYGAENGRRNCLTCKRLRRKNEHYERGRLDILANTAATFILNFHSLVRWSLYKYEFFRRDEHGKEIVKLDSIRQDIKDGTIANRVADIVADKMRDELAHTLAEAMTLLGGQPKKI